jgi:hypothetical protein
MASRRTQQKRPTVKDLILDTIAAAMAGTLSLKAERPQAPQKAQPRRRASAPQHGYQAPLSA